MRVVVAHRSPSYTFVYASTLSSQLLPSEAENVKNFRESSTASEHLNLQAEKLVSRQLNYVVKWTKLLVHADEIVGNYKILLLNSAVQLTRVQADTIFKGTLWFLRIKL